MSEITPALTPEQWAMDGTTEPVLLNGQDASRRVYFRQPKFGEPISVLNASGDQISNYRHMIDEGFGVELNADNSLSVWDDSWGISVAPEIRHGVAALCLYGQPFGFTHEDVAKLRDAAKAARMWRAEFNEQEEGEQLRDAVNAIADRIAALLPPLERIA